MVMDFISLWRPSSVVIITESLFFYRSNYLKVLLSPAARLSSEGWLIYSSFMVLVQRNCAAQD